MKAQPLIRFVTAKLHEMSYCVTLMHVKLSLVA